MQLSTLKPQTSERLTRTFVYAHRDDSSVSCKITASYLSPAVFDEVREREQVKTVSRGRVREQEIDTKALTEAIARDVLLPAIVKIEGAKVRHLRAITPLDPREVAELGKPDDAIPLDPGVVPDDIAHREDLDDDGKKAAAASQARDNLLWLLQHSDDLREFALQVVTNLSLFQDEKWEEKVADFAVGRSSNTET